MKIGTPENPEIIEPGQSPRAPRAAGDGFGDRVGRALRILMMMIKFSVPAFFLDSVCIWLFDMGRTDGSVFAWLLLLLLIFPALILTGLAVVVDLFLTFAFLATLSGRAVNVVQAPFAKFVRYPGGGVPGGGRGDGGGGVRDVTPPSSSDR
jgi:hypothetical protein